jgi:glycosyltransferase involved in cell wall biosynthesis
MTSPGAGGLVSIIIPTYRRAAEMRAAALSALAQTYTNIEVLIVADGPEPEARAAVADLDSRLRYMELERNSGPAEARNAGVRASRGEWLSFLDDDDTMLPEKIAHQMALADASQPQFMISCRTIYRREGEDDIWPQRPIADGEDVADYILYRPSLFGRPGVLPIQALLMHRSIVDAVPFTTHRDHEDWAWLLQAWHNAGARVRFAWEPLVIYNIVTASISRSRRTNWQDSLTWVRSHRQWIGRRAYNSFLATKAALKAKRAGAWYGLWTITKLVLRNRPSLLDILFLAGTWLLPKTLLQAAWKRSLRNPAEPHAAPANTGVAT